MHHESVTAHFLTGLSSATGGNLSENTAVGIGVSVVLVMVSLAVAIFISYGIRGKAYEYLKKELIETAYGVKGLVKEKKQDYEGTYTRGIILGVVFCILAVIPLLIGIAMEQPEYMITGDVNSPFACCSGGIFNCTCQYDQWKLRYVASGGRIFPKGKGCKEKV